MPMTVEEILARAKEAGASDVHITVGIPPKMRVNGDLLTMEGDRLMPADTLEIAAQVMNEKQQQRFEENGECDMSFAIAGQGRYRVNIYKQRGSIAMAFRLVDTKVPTAGIIGSAAVCHRSVSEEERTGAGHRSYGKWQVYNAGFPD